MLSESLTRRFKRFVKTCHENDFQTSKLLFFSKPFALHQMINVNFCKRVQVGNMSAKYPFDPYIQKETKSAKAFYSAPLVSEIKHFLFFLNLTCAKVHFHSLEGECGLCYMH